MILAFWVAAIAGSLAVLTQMILLMFGIGESDGDVDADTDFDGDGFDFPIFTVKSLIGFIGGFGWGGLIAVDKELSTSMQLLYAVVAGIVLALLVSTILYLLSKLKHTGNLRISNAIGKIGDVYLHIPAKRKGTGIVHVIVQDSMQELKALTDGEEIATGEKIQVTGVLDNTLIVKSLATEE